MAAVSLIVLGALAGCGAKFSPEQTAAMAKIQELGGRVNYRNGGYQVDFTNTPVEDKDLEILKHIPNLRSVRLQGTPITDAGLPVLVSITSLEAIWLQRSYVTREGVDNLKKALPNADVQY